MATGEFELIEHYFAHCQEQSSPIDRSIDTGIGDDAAVLRLRPGSRLYSEAALVSDADWRSLPADALAAHTLVALITRCYCRQRQPHWYTLNLALHAPDSGWLQAFSNGLSACNHYYGLRLVGGDTTSGKDSVLLRLFATDHAAPHSSARPSTQHDTDSTQLVYLTGYPGVAALARGDLEHRYPLQFQREQLLNAYFSPRVEPAWLVLLQQFATAAETLQQGLNTAVTSLTARTNRAFDIELPSPPVAQDILKNLESWQLPREILMQSAEIALICFTIPSARQAAMLEFAARHRLQPVYIGESV